MASSEFIRYQQGVLEAISHVVAHEDGRVIHLLPVVHVGEKRYYQELLEYIGDRMCVYESINLGSSSEGRIPQTFDEWLSAGEANVSSFYEEYEDDIKRFQKRVLTDELKQIREAVQDNLDVVDARLTRLFNQIEQSVYSIYSVGVIQTALADLLGVAHQYAEIDYQNDIPHRKNWVHGDLEFNQVPSEDQVRAVLSTSNPEIIENFRKQAQFLYGSLYWIQELIFMEVPERREDFAQKVVDSAELGMVTPKYLNETRNNLLIHTIDTLHVDHDEVVAFYGAAHMAYIKQVAVNDEFQWRSKQEFTVFTTEV
jgi:hypothetical protein